MKKSILLLLSSVIIFSGVCAARVAEGNEQLKDEVKTVGYVLTKASDKQTVVLRGSFSSQVDDDEFFFEDASGKVLADLSKHTRIDPNVSHFSELTGAKVKIRAIVKKKWSGRRELEVVRVRIEKMGTPPLSSSLGKVSDVLKNGSDKDTVVLEGLFSSQVDNDEFIFEDASGTINVELSKKTVITPPVSSFSDLAGAKVKIRAVIDKEIGEKMNLEVLEMTVKEIAKDTF